MRFRSGLEKRTADFLNKRKVKFQYEEVKLKWQDLRMRTYTPDFVLSNGIIIETKGRFISSDRTKHLFVKAQHPDLDIRFVFSNPKAKLYKGAKSSYGDWCDKHGFKYAKETIPVEWLKEKKK
tara:strand:+ start:17 stop:385 length:369 start_codon:yes stop_codon:yes gene_type:complete